MSGGIKLKNHTMIDKIINEIFERNDISFIDLKKNKTYVKEGFWGTSFLSDKNYILERLKNELTNAAMNSMKEKMRNLIKDNSAEEKEINLMKRKIENWKNSGKNSEESEINFKNDFEEDDGVEQSNNINKLKEKIKFHKNVKNLAFIFCIILLIGLVMLIFATLAYIRKIKILKKI
jgi:hypothetical protein